ncbi:MAG: hypothetical protein HPY58_12760 [Firmicutes bacterium]|nr:hypothetical protein [Bacillota bacterium]
MRRVIVARPEDLDLAIPPLQDGRSGITLRDIAAGYSRWVCKDWVRACNVEYRAGPNGPSVSLLAQGGKVWTTGDPRWPVFVIRNGRAEILDSITLVEAQQAQLAFSAGPWLVRAGHLCNLAEEINHYGYSGLRPADVCERAAIGIRSDGMVVYVATDGATLDEVATIMQQQGCSSAIALDGGGSVGVLDNTGRALLGSSARQVCSALMFNRIVDEIVREEVPKMPKRPLRVYLSPSQQPENKGLGDYGTEQQRMHELAWLVGYHLVKLGHAPIVSLRGQKLSHIITFSDLLDIDLHLALHSNALPAMSEKERQKAQLGVVAFHYPGSAVGKRVATALHDALGRLNPHGKGWFTARSDLREISETDAPCVYLEVCFHDDEKEVRWILDNFGLIARTIAETVVKALSSA